MCAADAENGLSDATADAKRISKRKQRRSRKKLCLTRQLPQNMTCGITRTGTLMPGCGRRIGGNDMGRLTIGSLFDGSGGNVHDKQELLKGGEG